jgi:hypothetical protein
MEVNILKELKLNVNEGDILELMKMYNTNDENEAVKMAIMEVIKKQSYKQIMSLNGNVVWEGNLDEMREQRT